MFETVSPENSPSHFALQVCYRNFVIISLHTCENLLVFLFCIVYGMIFLLSEVSGPDYNNSLKVGVLLISIKLDTHFQYVLNPNMDIHNTQNILLFRLMICATVFFWTHFMLSHFSIIRFLVCQIYAVIILELSLFETEKQFPGNFTAKCSFVCSRIHPICHCMYYLLLMLLS